MTYEILWAPWRMAYIEEECAAENTIKSDAPRAIKTNAHHEPEIAASRFDSTQDARCFICQGVVDTDHDAQRHIVARRETTITLLNIFPYNNGHLLVAPRRHCGRFDLLTPRERADLAEELNRVMILLQTVMKPDGFNVGLNQGHSAGAGLPGHLHWHIIPRWNGDTNFMTSVASVKVIPQALDALWKILTQSIAD